MSELGQQEVFSDQNCHPVEYSVQLVLYAALGLLPEVMFAAGVASRGRWRFDGSVEADDEGATVTAEQLGMCCSDADGVITCAIPPI